MKRSQEQKPRLKNRFRDSFTRTNLSTLPEEGRYHINNFLDVESKLQFSHMNKLNHQELKHDTDLYCLKSTRRFAACNETFKNIKIGEECLNFCQSHINEVIKTIINIMFSGRIYIRDINDDVRLLQHPTIYVNKSDFEGNEINVLEIDVNDLIQEDNLGEWVIREFDFVNENWFDIAIYFHEYGELLNDREIKELFYDFQGIEWELNYSHDYSCISIKNLSFVEETDEGDEYDDLDMEEPD
jgi:hypothetical protein